MPPHTTKFLDLVFPRTKPDYPYRKITIPQITDSFFEFPFWFPIPQLAGEKRRDIEINIMLLNKNPKRQLKKKIYIYIYIHTYIYMTHGTCEF